MKRFLIALVFCAVILVSRKAHAGIADDFLSQMSYTAPGHFRGQQRDYVTGGSAAIRWQPSTTDFPISVTPPSLRGGCGGIDVNLGAISYLTDPSYYQNKANTIIMGAGAVAFMMAVQEYCPVCNNAMNVAETIANQINQLQFDDCKASKVLVTKTREVTSGDSSIRAEADAAYSAISGAGSGFWKSVKDSWNANGGAPTASDQAKLNACSAGMLVVKQIFFTPQTYVLENIANKKGIPTSYMALVRGVVGDILIQEVNGGTLSQEIVATRVPPCKENKGGTLNLAKTGDIYERPAGLDASGQPLACVKQSDVNKNLVKRAHDSIMAVALKMKGTNTALTPDEKGFAGQNGYPIHSILKVAVANDEEAMIADELAEPVAQLYAYWMLQTAYEITSQSLESAVDVTSYQTDKSPACNIEHLVDEAILHSKELAAALSQSMGALTSEYTTAKKEIAGVMDYSQKLAVYNQSAVDVLTGAFGPDMARRAMGR